jgi:hypothetical protein
MLLSTIQSAKNLNCYEIANIAFAVLLDKALDNPKAYKFIWESQDNLPEEWQKWDELETYYDLAVISDGIQKACIPAPLLKFGIAKAFMSLSSADDKHQSRRKYHSRKWLTADTEIKQIWGKLKAAYPNALELAQKYLGCSPCMYFAGQGAAINCAPHPCGAVGTCADFAIDIDAIAAKAKASLLYEWRIEKENAAYETEQEAVRQQRQAELLDEKAKSSWSLGTGFKAIFQVQTCDVEIGGIPVKCRKSWSCEQSVNPKEVMSWEPESRWYQPLMAIDGYLVAFESAWCGISFEHQLGYSSQGNLPESHSIIVERIQKAAALQKRYYESASEKYNPVRQRWEKK